MTDQIVPTHWSLEPLNSISKIKGGKRVPKGETLVFENTGFPYIRVADFTDDGTVSLEDIRYVTEEVFEQIKNYTIDSSDLYISIAGTIGKSGIVPSELSGASLTENACKLVFCENICNHYVYYFTQTNYFLDQAGLNTRVAAMPKLALSRLGTIEIPFPPILEQKRIVAILDQAFADIDRARALTEQNLKNARELFDSTLQQVFSQRGEGWIKSSIKSMTTKVGSGATPRGGRNAYKSEGISLIRSMNVHDRTFRPKNLAFIDSEQADKLSNVVVEENDVLLNITGASVARCCVVPASHLPARVNQHVAIIRLGKGTLLPKLLNFLLTSKYYKDQLLGIGESGSTRQAITKKQIEDFEVEFPQDLEEQEELVSVIEKLETNSNVAQNIFLRKLNVLDELKKSLLQKAFSGQLTAKDAA